MFNYNALNDYEFEELCKDVMGRMLNTQLRSFGKGRDGGIDLKDNNPNYNIVVQVKHYINSDYSNLISSLKKEVDKVKKINPNQYYVCCAKTLSPPNVKEIYGLFETYMKSEKNIITLKEIEDFLKEESNNDIVRKHFKLWLSASNILSEMFNQSVYIDSQVLIEDVNEEYKYYVQTDEYSQCIKYLDESRVLLLTGSPGVGKTTISKMLILNYLDKGYRLRYSTNGEISDIKNSIVANGETPEIILLDDCLGQYYFNLRGSESSIELISLIKFVTRMKNKILILNSRVTVLNEAKRVSLQFEKFIENKKMKIKIIDMDKMSILNKAKILYNHMYFNQVPREYYESIKTNKQFKNIINHRNYNPRIIEYITQHYKDASPENYYSFILKYLNSPEQIWKDEFEIKLEEVDRIFMYILFSLTDTTMSEVVLKECFNKRLLISSIDKTLNHFENVLTRLNKSMIKIVDNKGEKEISVINPSVNDYLNKIFFSNRVELENTRGTIVFYEQIDRCYKNDEVDNIIKQKIVDNKFLKLKLINGNKYKHIEILLLCKIAEFKVLNNQYTANISEYIQQLESEAFEDKNAINKMEVIKGFLEEPLRSFYNLDKLLLDLDFINSICEDLELEDLIYMTNIIYQIIKNRDNEPLLNKFESLVSSYIEKQIEIYLESIEVDVYFEDIYISTYFKECENQVRKLELKDGDEFQATVIDYVIDKMYKDFRNYIIYELREFINKLELESITGKLNLYIDKIQFDQYQFEKYIIRYVDLYLQPDYDDMYDMWKENQIEAELGYSNDDEYMNEIDNIFDR